MAFSGRSLDAILRDILRDIRNLQSEADIGPDSDHYVRSAAVAAAIEGLYQNLAWVARQIFPDTADEAEMIRTAELRGIHRKGPVASKGLLALEGTADVELLQGAVAKHVASGELFTVLHSAIIGPDGTSSAIVEAQTAGSALNGLTGDLVLTSPPLGMAAAVKFVRETADGVNQESAGSVLARLLEDMQTPPSGGAKFDYKRWAKEVAGVADALVLPKRRGAGTVDVVVMGETDLPPDDVVAACQAHIESVCSVIVDLWVITPARRLIDCTANVELEEGYELEDVQAAAQSAYETLLRGLKPQETLKRSQVEAMINNLVGVRDRIVIAPDGNVKASDSPSIIGWIRPGVITLGVMAP